MAEFIKIYNENPNQKAIDKVVKVLKNGGLVIYPTDTVYGLGCDITNVKALERVARIKNVKLQTHCGPGGNFAALKILEYFFDFSRKSHKAKPVA